MLLYRLPVPSLRNHLSGFTTEQPQSTIDQTIDHTPETLSPFLKSEDMLTYPQLVYLITPPFFESVSYTSPLTNSTATIRNANFDPTYTDIYIQSATLSGAPYTKSWIGHEFFLQGGVLELTLESAESTTWGTGEADLPPSVGGGGGQYAM